MWIILTNLVLHFASLFCAGHCYEFEALATSGFALRSVTILLSELLGCRLTLGLSRCVHCSVLADVVVGRSVVVSVRIFDTQVMCVILCVLLRARVHCCTLHDQLMWKALPFLNCWKES